MAHWMGLLKVMVDWMWMVGWKVDLRGVSIMRVESKVDLRGVLIMMVRMI